MFKDEDFEAALYELEIPLLDNYELFVQFSDVKIYRKIKEVN